MIKPRCALALAAALIGFTCVRVAAQDVVVGQPMWAASDSPPDVMPKLHGGLWPDFPEEMRKSPEPGYAIVTYNVDATGKMLSLSYGATHPPYQQAVSKAGRNHDWSPAKRAGKAVDSRVSIAVIFNPKSAAAKGPEATPRLLVATPIRTRERPSAGTVVRMRFSIDETGAISAVAPGAEVKLEETVQADITEAVKAWRFAPARHGGKPVAAEMTMVVLCQPPIKLSTTNFTPPKVIKRVAPEYPAAMRRFGISGQVKVDFEVNVDGKVINPVIHESDIPPFDEPAIKAVLQWKFEPALRDGHPVKTKAGFAMIFDASASLRETKTIVQTNDPGDQSKLPAELRFDVPAKFRGVLLPIYPHEARLADERGRASVTILIDEKGRVAAVKVLSADRPEFGLALVAAAENFHFDPAYKDGKPVKHALRYDQDFDNVALDDREGGNLVSLEKKHPERVVSADQLDAMPTPLSRRSPIFPTQVAADVTSGDATIEFLVDNDGHARLPRVVSASAPAFGYAAVQAVGTWLFSPPLMKGKPVVTRLRVPLTFSAKSPVKRFVIPRSEPADSETK